MWELVSNILWYIVNSLTPDYLGSSPLISHLEIYFFICTKPVSCHQYTMKFHSYVPHSFNFMASLMVPSKVKTSPKHHLPQEVSSEIQSWIKWHSSMPNNVFIIASITLMKMFKYESDFVLSIIYSNQSKNI